MMELGILLARVRVRVRALLLQALPARASLPLARPLVGLARALVQ